MQLLLPLGAGCFILVTVRHAIYFALIAGDLQILCACSDMNIWFKFGSHFPNPELQWKSCGRIGAYVYTPTPPNAVTNYSMEENPWKPGLPAIGWLCSKAGNRGNSFLKTTPPPPRWNQSYDHCSENMKSDFNLCYLMKGVSTLKSYILNVLLVSKVLVDSNIALLTLLLAF